MNTYSKSLRMIGAALFAFALVAALCLMPQPQLEAADCGDGTAGGFGGGHWVQTPEAIAKQLAGLSECGENEICKQWCLTICNQDEPQPEFDCFPAN